MRDGVDSVSEGFFNNCMLQLQPNSELQDGVVVTAGFYEFLEC